MQSQDAEFREGEPKVCAICGSENRVKKHPKNETLICFTCFTGANEASPTETRD